MILRKFNDMHDSLKKMRKTIYNMNEKFNNEIEINKKSQAIFWS